MRSRYHRSGNGGPRHQNGQTSLNRNHVFDSNGPDTRIRGTAQQLHEKYLQHGRDALSSGDRVAAESFFQYAEHYSRILNAMNQSAQQRNNNRNQQSNGYSDNSAENTPAVQEEQPQVESSVETVEILSEPVHQPVEVVEVVAEEENPEPAPVRPARRGRPARSTIAKKKLQEESN